jgi:hypothetical protein
MARRLPFVRRLALGQGLALHLATPAVAAPPMVDGPRTLRMDAAGGRTILGGTPADLANDGTFEAVRVTTTAQTYGKITVYFSTCFAERTPPGGETTRRVLARWSSAQIGAMPWTPHAARFTPDGRFLSLVTIGGTLWLLQDHRPYRRLTHTTGLSVREARLVLDADDEPHVFIRRALSGDLERVVALDRVETVLEGVDYDWSVGVDAAGFVTVTAYDETERHLLVATARRGEWRWTRDVADTRESGWQHSLFATEDAVHVLSYYYRNPFNRGLNVVTVRGGAVEGRHTYLRLRDENGGWSPVVARLPDGRVRVSHRLREQAEETLDEVFPDVAAFLARRAEEFTGAWEDEYRAWSLSVAALPRWRSWSFLASRPSRGEAPGRVDATYTFEPALEMGASLEGRLGNWDLGLIYTQSLLDDPYAQGVQLFSGFIGVDQLLFGQDLKVSTSHGTYRGTYRDGRGERDATTPVTEVEVRLLNQRRLAWGVDWRRYVVPLPHYLYRAEPGETEYTFVGAGTAETTIHRLELFGGYSRIDYLTKYENSFHGFDVDLRGGIGLAFLDWPRRRYDGTPVDGLLDLALSLQGRLGYLVYHRFYGLQGAGGFIRGGYEGAWLGSGTTNDLPPPRDVEDAGVRDSDLSAAHHQLFHGPYLSLGLVY